MDDNTLKAIGRLCEMAEYFESGTRCNQTGINRTIDILEDLVERVVVMPPAEQKTGDQPV